ncbi:MAG TPA: heparan-alpha-glucosaminide N-acetyltransferase domain-containing protein [Gemmatimonadaceae bacterium]
MTTAQVVEDRAVPAPISVPATAAPSRVASVDIIRGAVMVLMAIDHVRVFAGIPAGGASAGLFFTRWVTHFCAPAFLFLAGSSAFLYSRTKPDVSRFLLTRGIWLVLLELTVIRLSWTFNFEFRQYMLAGVIWVIGWCMILMAGLVKLPVRVLGAIGLVIIFGHNLLDSQLFSIAESLGNDARGTLWKVLYVAFFAPPVQVTPDGPNLVVLYSIFPWIGVMAAGYAFGTIAASEPVRRDRLCLTIGLGAVALFLILRGFNLYGDPVPWSSPDPGSDGPQLPAVLSFLNTTKYPASLLFLLMTLGPTIALIPVLERTHGPVTRWMTVFGRVPFFFYVLHIPLIHVIALVVSQIRMGTVVPWLFANHPMGSGQPPAGYGWSLGLLYLVWLIVTVLLYFACRWYADLKARRKARWMAYL